ncbi:hypothetical protein [Desulfurobacterium sp.]
MAVALENGDYKKAGELAEELREFDFSSLRPEERRKLQKEVSFFIEKAKREEMKIAEALSKKLKVRKFLQ